MIKTIPVFFVNIKYDLVYADPPWKHNFIIKSRAVEKHYPTMTTEAICRIKLPLLAKNAILFLWATAPKLEDALEVMSRWGFKYKTHIIWDKQLPGLGFWSRGRHELLLIGVKGKMSPPSPSLRIPSVFVEKRRGHSQKPHKIKEYISDWYPHLRKMEVFARGPNYEFRNWAFPLEWYDDGEKRKRTKSKKSKIRDI